MKFRTNDEVICVFFNYIVDLPENEYGIICQRMKNEGPVPELMGKMICEADRKRNEIAKPNADI